MNFLIRSVATTGSASLAGNLYPRPGCHLILIDYQVTRKSVTPAFIRVEVEGRVPSIGVRDCDSYLSRDANEKVAIARNTRKTLFSSYTRIKNFSTSLARERKNQSRLIIYSHASEREALCVEKPAIEHKEERKGFLSLLSSSSLFYIHSAASQIPQTSRDILLPSVSRSFALFFLLLTRLSFFFLLIAAARPRYLSSRRNKYIQLNRVE